MTYKSPMPQIGLGTYGRTGPDGTEAILKAIELGYRHLDTAQSYNTESTVGEAVRLSGLPRSEFFITTKVADTRLDEKSFIGSVEASLQTLDTDYVDLLLIHWAVPEEIVPFEGYMTALADAKARGFARHIGVSNFPIALLEKSWALLGRDALLTNQIEIHPYLQSPTIRDFARKENFTLTAYQPLVKGQVAKDPVLGEIASTHGSTAGAVALAFLMAEGHAVIPASSSEANLAANLSAAELKLSAADMDRIRALDENRRTINPAKSPRWDD